MLGKFARFAAQGKMGQVLVACCFIPRSPGPLHTRYKYLPPENLTNNEDNDNNEP